MIPRGKNSLRHRAKLLTILLLVLCASGYSQTKIEVLLWPNLASESNGITEPEKLDNENRLINISTASMTIYFPDTLKKNTPAAIICPGGGYKGQAVKSEGSEMALWLNKQGIIGVVLKYRLPNEKSNIPLADAKRAIKVLRANAKKWKINKNKIAVIGFSAGGHLASTLGTHFDEGNKDATDSIEHFSSRPNLMALFYPVITMSELNIKTQSRKNLLGEQPTEESIKLYSNELHISKKTPPTILFLSDNDSTVPPENSIMFYSALKAKKIPSAMYIFPKGGHGWGMRQNFEFSEEWRRLMLNWLRTYQFSK